MPFEYIVEPKYRLKIELESRVKVASPNGEDGILRLFVFTLYRSVTDRETNRQTDERT